MLILMCTVLAAASAYVLSERQPKQYTAAASLLFRDPGLDQTLFGSNYFAPTNDPSREAATNLKLVSLDTVAARTARRIPGLTADAVSSSVTVEAQGQSNVVSVRAAAALPGDAARIANVFAEQYIQFRRDADRAKVADAQRLVERQLELLPPGESASEEGRSLRERSEQLRILAELQTGNAELVQRASIPSGASSPNPRRDAILGGFLGLLIGVAVAFALDRFDRRIRNPDEMSEAFKLPLLGVVSQSRSYSAAAGSHALSSIEGEAFRLLRARLRYFNVDRDIRSVLVTSAAPEEGKSTVAWYLAMAAAQMGARVLLLETDFRRPTVASRRGLHALPGLAELLTHDVPLQQVIQQVPVDDSSHSALDDRSLDVVVAGATPPNPSELLESQKMAELLTRLEAEYDLLVIDTPPTSAVSDAIPLIRRVSGVIVVSRVNKTTREAAEHLRAQLTMFDAPMLGLVANGLKETAAGYYGYGSGYGYAEPKPEKRSSRRFRSGRPDADVPASQLNGSALEDKRDAEAETVTVPPDVQLDEGDAERDAPSERKRRVPWRSS